MIYTTLTQFPIIAIAEVFILMSITLIAIAVTVFVLAITFLGEAIGLAKNEKELVVKKNIEEFTNKINKLNKEKKVLNQDTSKKELSNIRKDVDSLIEQKDNAKNNLKKIEKKYGSLKFVDSIIVPNTLFLFTIILTLTSTYLTIDINYKLAILFASLLFLGFGVYRIAYVLWVIESVAIGSDERRWKKMGEIQMNALMSALAKHEIGKKPKLFMSDQESSQLDLKLNEEGKMIFNVMLDESGGDFAEDVRVMFFVPPELELVSKNRRGEKTIQDKNFFIPNADSIGLSLGNITQNIKRPIDVYIKAKDHTGKFSLRYSIFCKDFQSKPEDNPEYVITVSN